MNARDLLDRAGKALVGAASGMRDELRTNPRARLGLIALVLVVLLAGALRAAQHAATRQAEIATLRVQERELAVLAAPEQAARWATADEEIAVRLAKAESLLWADAPVGVAHADFLAWLEAAAQEAGIQGIQIRLGDARRLGEDGQLTEMRVSLFATNAGGTVNQDAIYAFLRTVSDDPRAVFARSLRVRFNDPILLEAELAAFCRTEPPSAGARPGAANRGPAVTPIGQGSST